jgi:hypothetical protein
MMTSEPMSYKTRLNPPPANGWTPPPLPPLDDMRVAATQVAQPKKRTSMASKENSSPSPETNNSPRMANLFEEAPRTLFDEVESPVRSQTTDD